MPEDGKWEEVNLDIEQTAGADQSPNAAQAPNVEQVPNMGTAPNAGQQAPNMGAAPNAGQQAPNMGTAPNAGQQAPNMGAAPNVGYAPNMGQPVPQSELYAQKNSKGNKKVLAIIIILVAVLVACVVLVVVLLLNRSGGNSLKAGGTDVGTAQSSKTVGGHSGRSDVADADDGEDYSGLWSDDSADSDEGGGTVSSSHGTPTIDEQVIYDDNDVTITMTELDLSEGDWGRLWYEVENNYSNEISVTMDPICINGYMVDTMGYTTVDAGETGEDYIYIDDEYLIPSGISSIADVAEIEFSIDLTDLETYKDMDSTDLITIRTSIADSYEQTYDDSGTVIYDEGGIKVVNQGFAADEGTYYLYIENNTDRDIVLWTNDAYLDDEKWEFFLDQWVVFSGRKAVSAVLVSDDDYNPIDLSIYDSVEIDIEFDDNDNYDVLGETGRMELAK